MDEKQRQAYIDELMRLKNIYEAKLEIIRMELRKLIQT